MHQKIILSIALLLSLFSVRSQDFNSYSFNDLYGFEIETIYDIHQDQSANIWIGTNEGLVKFNGVDLTYFVHNDYSKSSTNIKEDAEGRIWYSNFGGQLFRLDQGVISVIVDDCVGSGFVEDYHFEGETVFYSSTKGVLVKKNIRTKEQSEIELNSGKRLLQSVANEEGYILMYDDNEKNGVSRNLSFWSYDYTSGIQTEIGNKRLSIASSKYDLFSDGKSAYYWRSNQKLEMFEVRNGKVELLFTDTQIQLNEINGINVKGEWFEINTKSGIYWIDRTGKLKMNRKSMDHFSISETMYDSEGNWWVCTLNDGIKIIPNKEFTNSLLSEIEIFSSCPGENGDLFLIDVKGGFYKTSPPYIQVESLGKKDLNIGGEIRYNSSDKCVYFSFSKFYFDTQLNAFRRLAQNNRSLLGSRKLMFLNEEEVVLCAYGRVIILNFKGNPLSAESSMYPGELMRKYYKSLRDENGYHIAFDEGTSDLYIGYKDAVYMYSKSQATKIEYLGENIIATSIIPTSSSGVWVSTYSGQLLKIEKGQVTISFDIPDLITKMVEWNGVLFLGAKKNVYRLDLETKSLNLLDASDGLLKERIVDLYIDVNTLVIVGKKHLQWIPCIFQKVNKTPPVLRIESILLFENKVQNKKYCFDYNENYITINFSATAIRSQGKCKYEYRLNGGDWIETTVNAAFATFPKLAPGSYLFEVRALNEDGLSSSVEELNFTIDQHFTQKWWFISLLLLSSASVILLVTRNRLRQLKRRSNLEVQQQQLRKEVYKSRIAALRAQMNPHFMFNALNTIQQFIITNQKEIASDYLADFADLMRRYLEQSKQEEVSLSEEIETLEIYLSLENLRSDGALKYSISCEPILNPFEIKLPVMLLQPYIENAIKHGLLHKHGEKSLQISFSKIGEQRLKCCIEDNGIGREASAKMKSTINHHSFAIEAMDQKMELLNNNSRREIEIQIEDLYSENSAIGTRVTLILNF